MFPISDHVPNYMSDGDKRNVVVGSFVVFTCSADRDQQVVWIKRSEDDEISNVEYPDWVEEHRVKVTRVFHQLFRMILIFVVSLVF